MFGFLKDKLKSWKDKIVEEFSEKPSEEPKKSKKTKEKASKKIKPTKVEQIVNKKLPSKQKKESTHSQTVSSEVTKESTSEREKFRSSNNNANLKNEEQNFYNDEQVVQPEQKKSFFSKLFSREENKTSELVIEDIKKEGLEIKGEEQRFEEETQAKLDKNPSLVSSEAFFGEERKPVGFFDRFKKKISQEKFDELFAELEMTLLQNNIAYEVVAHMKKKLSEELIGKNLSEINIEAKLRETISEILIEPPNLVKQIKEHLKTKKPFVIAFVGINGSGKTTSIAKVAHLLKKEKLSVCLAAADTFRAAAIEQLEIHANKIGIPIIKKEYNADPAAVGFEAIAYAKKHAIDVVLIDTAGRMNTKESLMKEMEKIIRVCNPDLKMFLGESITGNDATEQARAFNQHISIDGIILSKADIDEKGGAALSVSYITKKPIYFLGTGQKYDDLEVFDKEKILKSLGL